MGAVRPQTTSRIAPAAIDAAPHTPWSIPDRSSSRQTIQRSLPGSTAALHQNQRAAAHHVIFWIVGIGIPRSACQRQGVYTAA